MRGSKAYLFVFLLIACEGKVPSTQAELEANQAENTQPESTVVESKVPESFTSCDNLDIPSWEKRVFKLSRNLCEKCHNTDFAWNGIVLNSYESFTKNAEASVERIRTQQLSFSMNPIEIAVFLDWYDAGMPRSESDCQSPSADGS